MITLPEMVQEVSYKESCKPSMKICCCMGMGFNLNWKLESMMGKFAAIHFRVSLQERFMVLWLVLVK